MKQYLNILIVALLATVAACTDSPLEDWEPYLPSSGELPVSSISVDKTSITAGALAATESITITSTHSWTATASEPWISLSATSGSPGQTITISLAENTTTTKRTGSVTIKNSGDKSVVVNISQDGKSLTIDPTTISFEAEGGSSTVTVTANGEYSWNKKEIGSWLTVTQAITGLMVTAAKNVSPEQRSDTLTIYMTGLSEGSASHDVIITQFGTEYSFDIDKTAITASSSEYSDAVSLTTNDVWTARASDNWIVLSSTSGTGTQLININLTENKTPNERKGSVTFVGTNSKITKTVEVTQSGKTLTVNPTSVEFSNDGGSAMITVTTDGTFSATSKDSWISVKKNTSDITITAAANPGTSTRTGSVVVELTGLTSGKISQTITVTQSATSYTWSVDATTLNATSVKETHSFTLTTNDQWTTSSSNNWITLSATSGTGTKKINVTVSDNPSTNSRTGSITLKGDNSGNTTKITVTQDGRYLTVNPTSLTFNAEGGTNTVTVSTDGTFSTSTDAANWITVSTSGNTITVKATANTSISKRTGTVTVSLTHLTSGSLSRTITVTQNGANVEVPTVSPTSISVTSAATSKSISITSNANWEALNDASWITLSESKGSSNANITLSIDENKTTSSRTGTITIQNSAGLAKVTVTQAGKYLTVSPESLSFEASGGSGNVTVSTDGKFTTSIDANWITVSTSGNTITVHAIANTSSKKREGTVTVSLTELTSGSLYREIKVTQNGSSVEAPSVNPSSISVSSAATSKSISINSNANWTSSNDASWITMSSESGPGNTNVTLSISENQTTNPRTGTITIQNSAGTAKVTVKQEGKYLSVSPTTLTFDAGGGSDNIVVSTDGTFTTSDDADWITVTPNGNTITVKASGEGFGQHQHLEAHRHGNCFADKSHFRFTQPYHLCDAEWCSSRSPDGISYKYLDYLCCNIAEYIDYFECRMDSIQGCIVDHTVIR